MEQYFTVVSKSSALRKRTDEKQRVQTTKYHPYKRQPAQEKQDDDKEVLSLADSKPSSSKITKYLLATLADQSNPITHSDIGERSGDYRLI